MVLPCNNVECWQEQHRALKNNPRYITDHPTVVMTDMTRNFLTIHLLMFHKQILYCAWCEFEKDLTTLKHCTTCTVCYDILTNYTAYLLQSHLETLVVF